MTRRTAFAWLLVVAGALLLVARYDALVDPLPAFRTPLGEPTRLMAKSIATAFRLVMLGAAQLGATTVMVAVVRRAQHPAWLRFWELASLTAGAKTLLECVAQALMGTALASALALPLGLLTVGFIVAFIAFAASQWRAGLFTEAVPVGARAWGWLAACLAGWAVAITFPLLAA